MKKAIAIGLTALLTLMISSTVASPERQEAPKPGLTELSLLDLGKGVKMTLRLLPSGKFAMGSSDADKREGPQREVTLSKPFYLGTCEVTQSQWKAVMGTSLHDMRGKMKKNDWPLRGEGDDFPMYYLYWKDAAQFCKTLSEKTRRTVRLPTEAEWEYACRAGTTTAYFFGDDNKVMTEYGWLKRNSKVGAEGQQARPVGTRKPNAWGLYDMAGNVWEYCQD